MRHALAASSLQRTSSVIQSGRAEISLISSRQEDDPEPAAHVAQRSFRKRLVEVAVGVRPNGADDPRRVLLSGENHLGFGPNFAQAPQQREAVESVAALAGHYRS